jgi:hypothetical protein
VPFHVALFFTLAGLSRCATIRRYIEGEVAAAKAAAAAAEEETKGEGKDGGKSGDEPKVFTALDPVVGKPITIGDLKIATAEEATAYVKKYNNVLEEKKKLEGGEDGDGLDGDNNNAENEGTNAGAGGGGGSPSRANK